MALSTQLVDQLREFLQTWRPNDLQLVFATSLGTPWDAGLVVRRKLRPLLRSLGIQEAGLHAFRHANASLMDRLGTPLKVRQQRIGHADVRLTLQVYSQAVGEDHVRVAEQLGEMLNRCEPTVQKKRDRARKSSGAIPVELRGYGCGGSHCTEFDVSFPRLDLPFWSDLTHIVPVKSNCTQGCA
jgi:hypothetical protein